MSSLSDPLRYSVIKFRQDPSIAAISQIPRDVHVVFLHTCDPTLIPDSILKQFFPRLSAQNFFSHPAKTNTNNLTNKPTRWHNLLLLLLFSLTADGCRQPKVQCKYSLK